jgi:uncharacterized protein YggT (Ycf19 family)
MPDNILKVDEAERISQHEAVKGVVRSEVNSQIESQVNTVSSGDQSQVNVVADQMKQKAINEIGSTESSLGRAKTAARVSQVIDYLFYLIYGVIGLQIVLSLLGASNSNGFKSFLNTITWPLLAPFHKLMPNPSVGNFTFMTSYIAALVVYLLIHLAINGMLRMMVIKKTEV